MKKRGNEKKRKMHPEITAQFRQHDQDVFKALLFLSDRPFIKKMKLKGKGKSC